MDTPGARRAFLWGGAFHGRLVDGTDPPCETISMGGHVYRKTGRLVDVSGEHLRFYEHATDCCGTADVFLGNPPPFVDR